MHNELADSLRAQVKELTERSVATSVSRGPSPSTAAEGALAERSASWGHASEDARRGTEPTSRRETNLSARNSSAEQARSQSLIPDLAGLLSGAQPDPGPEAAIQSPHDAEVQSLRQQIQHLSDLLADSEQGVDRLQEQSKLLKSEIRRHENNTERAKVSADLEYLKNVILKFIGADEEREQLIPAIGMLLHFSKDELKIATKKYKAVLAAQMKAASADGTQSWLGWS